MTERLVSTEWLQRHLADAGLVVLDCTLYLDAPIDAASGLPRAEAEFLQAHIPGAQFVDVERELSDPGQSVRFMAPTAHQLSRCLQRLGIGADTRLVLYSRHEVWSATRVWWVLGRYGFDRVSVLDGGWNLWRSEGRPMVAGAPSARGGNPAGWQSFIPQHRLGWLADKDEVRKGITDKGVTLVNARLPEFFRGERGNVYGRPGRIARSVNVAAAAHLDGEGRFLPLPVLRAQFDAAVPAGNHVIAYCGYGIAASGTAFALALLGREGVALYDGSLAEWAPDPGLPMEAGAPAR